MSSKLIANRYQLIQKIGEGGAAEVFKAMDTRLDRLVALKLLRDAYANQPEFTLRFEREAKAAARLSHPHVVDVYDCARDDGQYFITMEYVPGQTLEDYLSQVDRLPEREVVRLGSQILRGLSAAHAAGLVHRDIKPQNVLIAADGTLKLTDFGIAKVMGQAGVTQAGLAFGTPHYLSPEQAFGEEVTPRSDLYAVGVMLYRMLSGRVPFESGSALKIAYAHLFEEPSPLRELVPEVSPAMAAVVERAMAKDPQDRFGSAEEVMAALETVPAPAWNADHTRTTTMEPPAGTSLASASPPSHAAAHFTTAPDGPAVARPGTLASRGGRRLSLPWILLPLLVFLIGGGLVFGGVLPPERDTKQANAPTVTALRGVAGAGRSTGDSGTPGVTQSADTPITSGGPTATQAVDLAPTSRSDATRVPVTRTPSTSTGTPGEAILTTPRPSPTRPSPPPSPDRLRTSVTSNSVGLTWKFPKEDGTTIAVERSTDGITYEEVISLPSRVTSFTDDGRAPGTTYFYRLRASRQGVNSDHVETSATTLLASPLDALPVPPGLEQKDAVQLTLEDSQFTGGFTNRRGLYKGRTARWVYTSEADPYSPTMSVEFEVRDPRAGELSGDAAVYFMGMDADGRDKTRVRIAVNGTEILNGPNPLPDDYYRDPKHANWGDAAVTFPASLLRRGTNALSITNLDAGYGFQKSKWFLVDWAAIIYYPGGSP